MTYHFVNLLNPDDDKDPSRIEIIGGEESERLWTEIDDGDWTLEFTNTYMDEYWDGEQIVYEPATELYRGYIQQDGNLYFAHGYIDEDTNEFIVYPGEKVGLDDYIFIVK
jgi:hypothetical protein